MKTNTPSKLRTKGKFAAIQERYNEKGIYDTAEKKFEPVPFAKSYRMANFSMWGFVSIYHILSAVLAMAAAWMVAGVAASTSTGFVYWVTFIGVFAVGVVIAVGVESFKASKFKETAQQIHTKTITTESISATGLVLVLSICISSFGAFLASKRMTDNTKVIKTETASGTKKIEAAKLAEMQPLELTRGVLVSNLAKERDKYARIKLADQIAANAAAIAATNERYDNKVELVRTTGVASLVSDNANGYELSILVACCILALELLAFAAYSGQYWYWFRCMIEGREGTTVTEHDPIHHETISIPASAPKSLGFATANMPKESREIIEKYPHASREIARAGMKLNKEIIASIRERYGVGRTTQYAIARIIRNIQ